MPKRRGTTGDTSLPLFSEEKQSAAEISSPKANVKGSIESGATGGPSTIHGVDYQLKVAVYEGYRMMAEILAAPVRDLSISLEARNIHEEGVTRWDVGLGLPSRLLEIKLNASRTDILEWLDRVSQAHDGNAEFRLVYSRASGVLEASVSRLIRLANEASLDEQRFVKLYKKEQIRDADLILRHLGQYALGLLQRMALRQMPEEIVGESIAFTSRMLCPTRPVELTRYLRDRFMLGMQHRRTYSIRELIAECEREGFEFVAPQAIVREELARPLRAAVSFLRHCAAGSPSAVLAQTLECAEDDLSTLLAPLINGRSLALDAGRWRLLIRPPEIPVDEERAVLERGLTILLRYIEDHEHDSAGRSLLLDAVQLTRVCARIYPPAVIKTFRNLEKLLKRHGNKRLVLELAELTIEAARSEPVMRDEEWVRAEAQALVCGRSWALQRLGDLLGAQQAGRESLELGQAIGWARNTGFCQKCNGRLARMYGEQEASEVERAKYFKESIDLLSAAIETFSTMNDIGRDHFEVGDCYSLIARTYLVGKQFDKARRALREAYQRIPPKEEKDYLDLLILTGDLEAATGAHEEAENRYTEALSLPESSDVQISEIFARGYLQRGKNRATLGRVAGATEDFARAATIWTALEEYEQAAHAQWEEIRIRDDVDENVLSTLGEHVSHLVRIVAYERYVQQYRVGEQTVAQRAAPSEVHLRQILRDATRYAKIKYPRP